MRCFSVLAGTLIVLGVACPNVRGQEQEQQQQQQEQQEQTQWAPLDYVEEHIKEAEKARSTLRDEFERKLAEVKASLQNLDTQHRGEIKAAADKLREDYQKADKELVTLIAQETGKLETAIEDLRKQLQQLRTRLTQTENDLLAANRRISANSDGIKGNGAVVAVVNDRVNSLFEHVFEIDPYDKIPVLSWRKQMQSDVFSSGFRKHVHEASPPVQGRLVIINDTGTTQHLYVNGRLWHVPAVPRVTEVPVPVGRVVTQLWPHEGPKTWDVGRHNNYTVRIRIYPGPYVYYPVAYYLLP